MIIGFLIISTVVAAIPTAECMADNWFPYNFYCCSSMLELCPRYDNWFPYNFYCCSFGFPDDTTIDNWFPYNFYCCSIL